MKGNAHVVRGASTTNAARIIGGVTPAAEGHWLLSPNASTVTITQLTFRGDGEATVDLTGCTPSYQRDTADLTSILDCPFEVPVGTYDRLDISVAGEAKVTVDDVAHGLFTDPNAPGKLAGTAPAGGAQSVTVTVPTAGEIGNTIEAGFVDPLVVAEGQPVTITILEDMIHTMAADVSSGSMAFDLSLPLPPVSLIATAGSVGSGSVEYYAPTGTADNYTDRLIGTGNEAGAARVFYVNGKPTFAWHVVPSNSEAWAVAPQDGSQLGGYLGLDSTGTLCWAHTRSSDLTWQDGQYAMICRMHRATNVGETTAIECKHQTTAPAPTSGNTYESGCPAFTPDETTQVTLVAK